MVSICWIIIIKTTIKPARVVIIACSSRPERTKSWFKTATIMPIAAILKIKFTSMVFFSFLTLFYKNSKAVVIPKLKPSI